MREINIQDFNHEVDCIYDGEQYSVRDNGAVLRHPRTGRRPRPTDNQWTFGKPNSKNGYMYITDVRIHRIVATAFHGEPPTKEHVVDHIDTNRRNNRPENLRWLTRLENVLLNPITVKRVEFICGSIEAFLEDPSILSDWKSDRNFEWMRTVSPEEAKACKERMHIWAKSDKSPSGGSLGEWVFKPIKTQNLLLKSQSMSSDLEKVKTPNEAQRKSISPLSYPYSSQMQEEELITFYIEKFRALGLVISDTPGAVQRNWRTPTEFPCCPQNNEADPISAYADKLKEGVVFARNKFSTSVVLESAIAESGQSILVMNQQAETEAIKPWSLAQVTYEDGWYVHTSVGTFFTKDGAEKQFCLARGSEWTGGDTFDEFC